MKHANIALFVPHNGCPHQCSFCDQRAITGQCAQPTPEDVRQAAESWQGEKGAAQIAFFGGSFTAIDRSYMLSLLEAAYPYVQEGLVSGIRISTRPDAINGEILDICARYGVEAIELGAQSMDEEVLKKNARGHSAWDVETAARLISARGFSLGLQMMTGLYGDTPEKAMETAERLSALHPDTMRIYPTILLPHTPLEILYRQGLYRPQTLEEAVELGAKLLLFFESRRIPVIRLGLHDSQQLRQERIAGPYHPALRELCESRVMRERMEREVGEKRGWVTLAVHPKSISRAVGQKKSNLRYFEEKGILLRLVQDSSVEPLGCRAVFS